MNTKKLIIVGVIVLGTAPSFGDELVRTNDSLSISASSNTTEQLSMTLLETGTLRDKDPATYLLTLNKNAQKLILSDCGPDECQIMYRSFTNMLHKFPDPELDLNAYELLTLQDRCLDSFASNRKFGLGRDVWRAVAIHLGKIREAIDEKHHWQGPFDLALLTGESLEKQEQIREEFRRKGAIDNFQTVLRKESQSVMQSLLLGMGNLSAHEAGLDIDFVNEIISLSRLDKDEAERMRRLIQQKGRVENSSIQPLN